MSSIYIQEPPCSGKVCLKASVGDIDIELWSRECPKACRNFVQLCMEGYYNGTIFHRVVAGFIVQGGDPTGTGLGGDSIYGRPFKDEFHSRLRFVRRGLVAMANAGANDNGSQFFFTLGPAPELQEKHTIFGKVVGDTMFNMLKLGETTVDKNEKPLNPHKITGAEIRGLRPLTSPHHSKILNNPFPDIVPRKLEKRRDDRDRKKKKKEKEKLKAVKAEKNFNLLSFGDEAEEEEGVIEQINKKISGKGKSAHDLLAEVDEKLSREPAVRSEELRQNSVATGATESVVDEEKGKELKERIREKLKKGRKSEKDDSESKRARKTEEKGVEGEEGIIHKLRDTCS